MIEAMGKRLIAEGCDSYNTPVGPVWNDAHRRSYAAYQIKRGYRGPEADGIPGQATWKAPCVPLQASTPEPTTT